MESGDKVPDEKTVWLFREKMTTSGLVEEMFTQFNKDLEEKGVIMNEGKMIDARWTKKNGETFYGYKNYTKVDTKSKFIDKYTVTDSSVHDSQSLDDLLEEKDKGQALYADIAYTGEDQQKVINKYKVKNKVHEKGYRNKPLTNEQKARNKEKSKTHARVEHVFGFMDQSMNGLYIKRPLQGYVNFSPI